MQKKFVFGRAGFFWYWCFSLRLTVFLPPLPEVQCQNFLKFRISWKSNGKKWSQIWKLLPIKGVKPPRRIKVFFYGFCFHLFTPFKCLFAPTSPSPMSKLFNLLKFFLLQKGCKIGAHKIVFLANFALLAGFFLVSLLLSDRREIFCLPYAGFFFMWHVTCYTWIMTHDMWHMTCDRWQVISVGGNNLHTSLMWTGGLLDGWTGWQVVRCHTSVSIHNSYEWQSHHLDICTQRPVLHYIGPYWLL